MADNAARGGLANSYPFDLVQFGRGQVVKILGYANHLVKLSEPAQRQGKQLAIQYGSEV